MKQLFNYCYQPRAYADSVGYCLVELEEGETIKDVLKEYIVPKDWFEQQYLNAKEITEYKHKEKNILRETCFNEYKSSVFRLKEMKEKIIYLYKKGLPIIAITRKLYLSYGYVYNVIRMHERGLKDEQ